MSGENIIYLNGAFVPRKKRWCRSQSAAFSAATVSTRLPARSATSCSAWTSISTGCSVPSYVRIDVGITREELAAATQETLDRNLGRIDTRSDYAVWHVITRGDNVMGGPSPTIVALFCVEIEFDIYAGTYVNGLRLITPGVRRTPVDSIDPKAKVLSRMNQIQAALEVKRVDPGATPLMLVGDGNITETNTGNFFFVADGKLCTSRARIVLGGVTRATILELAAELCIEVVEGDYTSYDVYPPTKPSSAARRR